MKKLTVLVADADPRMNDALAHVLSQALDAEVVAEVTDGRRVVPVAQAFAPDLVTVDSTLPHADAVSVIARLTRSVPTARTLLVTPSDDRQLVFAGLAAGASGVLSKEASVREFVRAAKRAVGDECAADPDDISALMRRLAFLEDALALGIAAPRFASSERLGLKAAAVDGARSGSTVTSPASVHWRFPDPEAEPAGQWSRTEPAA